MGRDVELGPYSPSLSDFLALRNVCSPVKARLDLGN